MAMSVQAAEMSRKSINDLPDSAFAYIEPGGKKDSEGKTIPRSLRQFPVHDEAHARNALARATQSPFGAKALSKIKAACRRFGIKVAASEQTEEDFTHFGYITDLEGYELEEGDGTRRWIQAF